PVPAAVGDRGPCRGHRGDLPVAGGQRIHGLVPPAGRGREAACRGVRGGRPAGDRVPDVAGLQPRRRRRATDHRQLHRRVPGGVRERGRGLRHGGEGIEGDHRCLGERHRRAIDDRGLRRGAGRGDVEHHQRGRREPGSTIMAAVRQRHPRRRPAQDVESRVRTVTDEVKHTADTTEKAGGVAVGVADEAVAAAPDTPGDNGRDRTAWRAVLKEPSGLILLIVALVAAAAVTASLWKFQYRLDVQTNTDAAQVAVDAATEGTIALLSYAPETLQEDFAAAKEHLTGEFLDYYTEFTDTV